MNRRSFLKRAGAATLAIVSAPLFIPSERLAFGVPKPRIVVPEPLLTRTLIGPDDEEVQSFVMPRIDFDPEWNRGIERFMKNFGADEYRIDANGASGKASMHEVSAPAVPLGRWYGDPIVRRVRVGEYVVTWPIAGGEQLRVESV